MPSIYGSHYSVHHGFTRPRLTLLLSFFSNSIPYHYHHSSLTPWENLTFQRYIFNLFSRNDANPRVAHFLTLGFSGCGGTKKRISRSWALYPVACTTSPKLTPESFVAALRFLLLTRLLLTQCSAHVSRGNFMETPSSKFQTSSEGSWSS